MHQRSLQRRFRAALRAWREAAATRRFLRAQGAHAKVLLERRLLRRLSTGEIIEPEWTRFSFPPLWHYDVLRALDHLRAADITTGAHGTAGVYSDADVSEALAIVRARRSNDGTWPLDVRHRNTLYEHMCGAVGAPNRWITLRALRVLAWAERD